MINQKTNPILLIFGPSGVGKTTLAEWIAEDCDFLHFNFDNWDGKGINGHDTIRDEWRHFHGNYQIDKLRTVIDAYLSQHSKKGAVVTFPSNYFISIKHLKEAGHFGINTLILCGSEELCRSSFLLREKETARNLDIDHWNNSNKHIYTDGFLSPEHVPYIENAFENDRHRSRASLIEAVSKRLGLYK